MIPDIDPDLAARLAGHVERVDHFSIAARTTEDVAAVMALMGGLFIDSGEDIDGFRWSQYRLPGGGKAEVIAPAPGRDADHFLVKYLERHGPGLHHITLKVHDLAAAMDAAEEAGFRVVDPSTKGPWKEAFIHPGSASGILIQLAEWEDHAGIQQEMAGEPENEDLESIADPSGRTH